MPVWLEFAKSHRYNSMAEGIEVPVFLHIGRQSVDLIATLDKGAAYCIFERRYGELLGLRVESGRLLSFRTMAGFFYAYEHEVTVETLDIEFSAFVFFARDATFDRNFLGRTGWLDRVRVGLIDYDRTLYLGAYDHEEPAGADPRFRPS